MNAVEKIKAVYDKDELKKIANHGCQSGVCYEHIYYADTIKFFDNHEDEIVEYISDNYGTEFLVELFEKADADLGVYKNNVTWCFIEMIAFQFEDEELASWILIPIIS